MAGKLSHQRASEDQLSLFNTEYQAASALLASKALPKNVVSIEMAQCIRVQFFPVLSKKSPSAVQIEKSDSERLLQETSGEKGKLIPALTALGFSRDSITILLNRAAATRAYENLLPPDVLPDNNPELIKTIV